MGLRAGLDWCGKSCPTGIRSPDRPARRQSLYRLSYTGPPVSNYSGVIKCGGIAARFVDYTLITNLMHWLLFIHKILFSSTWFEPEVLIFRRIRLYTCSIWHSHSVREFVVACRYASVHRRATTNSRREWQYHMLHAYNCILLKMSAWCSKHVEENSILRINNNQCIKLVIDV